MIPTTFSGIILHVSTVLIFNIVTGLSRKTIGWICRYRRCMLVSRIWSHFSLLIVISISLFFLYELRSYASIIQQKIWGSNLYNLFFYYFVYPWSTWKFHRTHWNMSMLSRLNWNLEVLVFKVKGKPEYQEKQGSEPTTNSNHIWCQHQDSNLGHIGGRRVLSPLSQLCSLALAPKFQATEALSCQQQCIRSGMGWWQGKM